MAIEINGTTGISGVDGTAGSPALQGADTNTGVSFGTDEVAINTGGTERVKVDSSGRVGIGTTATQQKLTIDVNDSGTTPASFNGINIANTNTTANNGSAITFGQTISGNSNARIGVIQTARGPSESQEMFFGLLGNGSYSERMRINGSGNVGIGTTSLGGYRLHVTSDGATTMNIRRDTSSGGLIDFNFGNSGVGNISTNGSTTSYNTSSDYRLKENVVDLDGAITRVKQLSPKRFNFIADAETTVDGFLAHEAQTVVPEAVTGTHDQVDVDGNPIYQGIDQSKLVPLLTAALQEAIAKIETLEAKVAALEGGAS